MTPLDRPHVELRTVLCHLFLNEPWVLSVEWLEQEAMQAVQL